MCFLSIKRMITLEIIILEGYYETKIDLVVN